MSRDLNRNGNAIGRPANPRMLAFAGGGALLLASAALWLTATAGASWAAAVHHSTGPVARPQAVAPQRQLHVLPGTIRNPHLHLSAHAAHHKSKKHHHHHSHSAVAYAESWHHSWNYHSWAAVHRGLGTVQGVVRDKHGQPLAFAEVELAHSNGHSFHHANMRHKTHTNAAGAFVMFGVRAGHYRVRSRLGKKHGHRSVKVHTNTLSTTALKI